MKVRVVYVKGNEDSEAQANISLKSWLNHDWDAELHEGYTHLIRLIEKSSHIQIWKVVD